MAGPDGEVLQGRITPSKNNGVHPSLPSISLSREHITEAFKKSPDGGATLDLAHKNLTDVGEDGAEELASVGQDEEQTEESAVVRIALAHNRLTTLPMAFALLSRLRYLVLKNNNFTIFPDVLTIMPSLEILDISRNKIKRLPSQPGSLIKLRVFSLFRNKLHRLPPYFARFHSLHIFKVDQNPLEWPPKEVMETPRQSENSEVMRDWIRDVQRWIDTNSPSADRKFSEDSMLGESSFMDFDHDSMTDEPREGGFDVKSPFDDSLFVEGHSRSFSLESDVSNNFDGIPGSSLSRARSPRSPRPPRLHLDVVPTGGRMHASASPARSPDSYLPTPEESVSSNDDESSRSGHSVTQPQHGRNASFAGGSTSSSRRKLTAKKSLPDMRPAKLDLNGHQDQLRHLIDDEFGIPSPPHRQESDSSNDSLPDLRSKVFSQNGVVSSPVSLHRPAPHMDGQRHQYFRRISTLNPGSLAKAIPPALLTLVDAVRGILFGVSQIYQALQHYTEYGIEERLSAVLLKVLEPASVYMNQLIHALDRFDSMSKRIVPPPAVCRAVIESCRDNVAVFGKALGVLTLQLKVLATHDDVRYTRQMLLMLYGAMAEIASAWQTIASHMDAVRPLLRDHRAPPAFKAFTSQSPTIRTTAPILEGGAPSPFSSNSAAQMHTTRSSSRTNSNGPSDGRVRINRRHAGSFSYKDVEIGKLLPSNVEPSPVSAGVAPASHLRSTRVAPFQDSRNDGTIRPSASSRDLHSRQSSTSSMLGSSVSSPSLPGSKPANIETASAANTLVDKEAIDAIQLALEAAPSVWQLTEELMQDDTTLREELNETLQKAKDGTDRLRNALRAVTNDASSKKTLRDDAHAFISTVIQMSKAIRLYGMDHSLSSSLRTNMVKLTDATQAFVMLLHVSSFASHSTPASRPYTPMTGVPPPPPLAEDGRLGANLSRSRSAISSGAVRLLPPMKEPPRSALPHTTFTLSPPTRLGANDWTAVPG